MRNESLLLTATTRSPLSSVHVRWLTLAALIAVFLMLAPGSGTTASPNGTRSLRDTQLTLYVRNVLRGDPQLAPLNLWVSVRQNVAILSGDVPSEVLAQRALELVGRVQGVGEVRSELTVVPRDGFVDGPAAFPQGLPTEPSDRKGVPSGDLTGQTRDSNRTIQVPKKADMGEITVPSAHKRSPQEVVVLGAPIPLTSLQGNRPPSGPAALLEPRPRSSQSSAPPQKAGPSDLATIVEAIRRQDERFARIRVDIQQGTVYLRGPVSCLDNLQDLAGLVRRLPGVQAVVLETLPSR